MYLVLFVNVWSLCSLHLGKNAFPFTLRIQMIACNCALSQFWGLNFSGNLLLPTWSLHFLIFTFILTCSRPSILLSNKLWAFAGGRPSKSQQRLLNHTFTSWSTKSTGCLKKKFPLSKLAVANITADNEKSAIIFLTNAADLFCNSYHLFEQIPNDIGQQNLPGTQVEKRWHPSSCGTPWQERIAEAD